jgi:hypothetical protein
MKGLGIKQWQETVIVYSQRRPGRQKGLFMAICRRNACSNSMLLAT